MEVFANAKINIGLQILRKRPDGFHDIASCFYPVQWADKLEITPSDVLDFSSSGLDIPGDATDNLCLKAYRLLKADFPSLPAVHIHLQKIVPIGAGMGGGSSDAAFTLKVLNEMFFLGLSSENLQHYARRLGSDCAFFVENVPVLAKEKGDVFEKISLSLEGLHLLLVYPMLHVSTQEAYSGVKPQAPEIAIEKILQLPVNQWKNVLKNDFEVSIFPKYPVIEMLKNELYEAGALFASMTGSGSAVFGLFQGNPPENYVNTLLEKKYVVWKEIL